ncbi:MAG: hypothetical protein PSV46_05055, partial [Reyranella sp.]|nr:hypothetical protein [Reyranella sp.]
STGGCRSARPAGDVAGATSDDATTAGRYAAIVGHAGSDGCRNARPTGGGPNSTGHALSIAVAGRGGRDCRYDALDVATRTVSAGDSPDAACPVGGCRADPPDGAIYATHPAQQQRGGHHCVH